MNVNVYCAEINKNHHYFRRFAVVELKLAKTLLWSFKTVVQGQCCASVCCQKVKCCLPVFIKRHYNSSMSAEGSSIEHHNNPENIKLICVSHLLLFLFCQYYSPHPVVMLPGFSCVQSGAAAVLPQ